LMKLVSPPVNPGELQLVDVVEGGVLEQIKQEPVTSQPHASTHEADKVAFFAMVSDVNGLWLSTFQAYLDNQQVLPPSEVVAAMEDAIGTIGACTLKNEANLVSRRWDDDKLLEKKGLQKDFRDKGIILHWFTMETPPVYSTVSMVLNDSVERVKPENPKVKAVIPFVKVLLSAVDDLMAVPDSFKFEGVAYRGMPYKYSDDQWTKFEEGKEIIWYTVKSVATHRKVMQEFLGPDPMDRDDWSPNECTIFIVKDCVAPLVEEFSCFREETEALLKPGTRFKVLSAVRCSNATSRNVWERADQITLRMIV